MDDVFNCIIFPSLPMIILTFNSHFLILLFFKQLFWNQLFYLVNFQISSPQFIIKVFITYYLMIINVFINQNCEKNCSYYHPMIIRINYLHLIFMNFLNYSIKNFNFLTIIFLLNNLYHYYYDLNLLVP